MYTTAFKPGDSVTVYIHEKTKHAVPYVLSEKDFDEDGDIDEHSIEASILDTIDWNLGTVLDRTVLVTPNEKE